MTTAIDAGPVSTPRTAPSDAELIRCLVDAAPELSEDQRIAIRQAIARGRKST